MTIDLIKNEKRLNTLLTQYKIPEKFRYFEKYRPHFHLIRFEKNELLYSKEFQRQYLIFLLNGKIKVCSNLSNGKSMLVCFYTSFQFLGDLEFCGVSSEDNAILAVEPCLCISLQVTEIKSQLVKDDLFLMYLSQSLANKLATAARNNSINLLYPLENRLAAYICQARTGDIFAENLTQLAELMGTSYRHLLRVLKGFLEEGILEKLKAGYRIKNPGKLMELAQDSYLT